MIYVLDACAVIAYERNELGAEAVREILIGDDACWIYAINLCEVYYDFLRVGGSDAANQILRDLNGFEVNIYQGMESDLWRSAAYYKATLRRISLADCFALALTKSLDATLVTSDRGEFTAVVEKDLCHVQFIR